MMERRNERLSFYISYNDECGWLYHQDFLVPTFFLLKTKTKNHFNFNSMKSFFVGTKSNPSFLVEVTSKKIIVYQPDTYSKKENFYERYSLGKKVMETNYSRILFKAVPIPYKYYFYVPELIVIIKKKHVLIKNRIEEIDLNN